MKAVLFDLYEDETMQLEILIGFAATASFASLGLVGNG